MGFLDRINPNNMINEEELFSFGADLKTYDPDDLIFSEGEVPCFFFLISKGKIKLNNYNEEGKEFIQGIFSRGQSVGLSSLFTEKTYPVNAVAVEGSEIIRLSKAQYFQFLKQHPEKYFRIIQCLSEHMHYKFLMMQSMAFQKPAQKLLTLMTYLKDHHHDKSEDAIQILLTRQQLASLTGLSVETVIRVIKSMEKEGILKIQNRKIFY
ncbi:cAMP-activated global transcriptional regulator CRP [Chryseobacterium sp. MOF25P]|uniref:Crp/Fnr family transcriptional regulator n=1 Tax=unclassified Chryseobacterium TaxID=2593645 RepID=UPI000805D629|nr:MULTISPECIES: Crp/Fnr family transcriptional regulator [unclassified Chryseobacterium]OBW41645.1 cAMP-activated global transcriptional regulator CRP [Chryseobacterium sp. MOF25P]OBW47704.1 cAMP-activated global transcriptional regulator CRP [Chryseobacterium sp. BGARF1]